MKKDPLYEILDRHIHSKTNKFDDQKELVHQVVSEYLYFLMQQGNIVESKLDEMEQDLIEEVNEMISKKTYGYFDLQQYRSRLRQ